MTKQPYTKKLRNDTGPCQVCGKPRGKGVLFIDHGKCVEILAAKSAQRHFDLPRNDLGRLSEEDKRQGKANQRKKRYLSGKLPSWMTDK